MWSNILLFSNLAAVLSGFSFIALLIVYPTLINEVSQIEDELNIHRLQFNEMSNKLWIELLQQSNSIRRSIRSTNRHPTFTTRLGQQYSNEYGDVDESERADAGAKGSGAAEKLLNKCPIGPQGPPGDAGERGIDGLDGEAGKPGKDGIYESPKKGLCSPCPTGAPGFPGYKGPRGSRGSKGVKGPRGPSGRNGEKGDEGSEGDLGFPGEDGPQGKQGPPGKDGTRYAKGSRGPKGKVGPPGPIGDEGRPGERGKDASAGPPGDNGQRGPPGIPGRNGKPGPKGKQGNPGTDASYCSCPERGAKKNENKTTISNGESLENEPVPRTTTYIYARPSIRPPLRKVNDEDDTNERIYSVQRSLQNGNIDSMRTTSELGNISETATTLEDEAVETITDAAVIQISQQILDSEEFGLSEDATQMQTLQSDAEQVHFRYPESTTTMTNDWSSTIAMEAANERPKRIEDSDTLQTFNGSENQQSSEICDETADNQRVETSTQAAKIKETRMFQVEGNSGNSGGVKVTERFFNKFGTVEDVSNPEEMSQSTGFNAKSGRMKTQRPLKMLSEEDEKLTNTINNNKAEIGDISSLQSIEKNSQEDNNAEMLRTNGNDKKLQRKIKDKSLENENSIENNQLKNFVKISKLKNRKGNAKKNSIERGPPSIKPRDHRIHDRRHDRQSNEDEVTINSTTATNRMVDEIDIVLRPDTYDARRARAMSLRRKHRIVRNIPSLF